MTEEPSAEEIVDFIKQCRSNTPATSDANQYIKVMEWLFCGRDRPTLDHNFWFDVRCKDCGWQESGYGRSSPSSCPNCFSTDFEAESYSYNPKFIENNE